MSGCQIIYIKFNFKSRYDAKEFCSQLREFVQVRQQRGRSGRKIRYAAYCIWALALKVCC